MTPRFAGSAVARAIVPLGGLGLILVALPPTPSGAHATDLVAASALLAAGSIAWLVERRWQGACAVLSAVALAVVANADPVGGGASIRGLSIVAGPLVVPLSVGAMGGRGRWWWTALVGGVIAGPLRALVYDPFLDPNCALCRHNPAAISHHPELARVLLVAGTALTALAVAAIAAKAPRRWSFVTVALIASAAVWWSGIRFAAGLVAVVVIAIDIVHSTAARRRVSQLVQMLREEVDLEQTLGKSLGDPALRVAYWLDEERCFAAKNGGPDPGPTGAQITTELRMGADLVALIHHDPAVAEVAALAGALDGPARLALENERLAAQLASQARELQRSRARIVERGDIERRRLERDVHDGAQQHVLALGFDLRTMLANIAPDDPTRPILERCLAETMSALDELRELSHGLYPPSLEAGGLSPALGALSRRAPVAVAIGNVPRTRLPTAVERTVFALVADSTAVAQLDLDIEIELVEANVEVRIFGAIAPSGQVVLDRIAALDGSLTRSENTIRAMIPCAL